MIKLLFKILKVILIVILILAVLVTILYLWADNAQVIHKDYQSKIEISSLGKLLSNNFVQTQQKNNLKAI